MYNILSPSTTQQSHANRPIITCGGMRIQETWIPDTIPLLKPNKRKVVKSPSQDNLKDVIQCCLKLGLNHFETARFYGSSEVQFVNALVELIEEGTVKRSDFIFQTKLFPMEDIKKFKEQWEASWSNVHKLHYVDLLSFHCVSQHDQIDYVLNESSDGIYAFIQSLQTEGTIRHIGFSTHGSAETILRMINSNKFAYVNIHKHYFGDYHAQGTPDTLGGHGNEAAVKRALELDMGVFNISPFDKGGKLYRPSEAVAKAIGPELSPIAFAALHSWKTQGMHTVSVGFARSSDLDEVIEAAKIYAADDGDKADVLVKAAEERLNNLAIEKLGKEWFEKGLLNVPSFYDKPSDGMALGHILWIHNCMTAYGMYEFCNDRYGMLLKTKWVKTKSYEENVKANFNSGNPGRAFDDSVDLTEALKDHYDPEQAKAKLQEVHNWFKADAAAKITDEEKVKLGWKQAYNLTTWEEFPGEVISVSNILLGRMGLKSGGGPSKSVTAEAVNMRGVVRRRSSLVSLPSVDVDVDSS
jgi:predicted aldo/keto reductase-like oxidoreductase